MTKFVQKSKWPTLTTGAKLADYSSDHLATSLTPLTPTSQQTLTNKISLQLWIARVVFIKVHASSNLEPPKEEEKTPCGNLKQIYQHHKRPQSKITQDLGVASTVQQVIYRDGTIACASTSIFASLSSFLIYTHSIVWIVHLDFSSSIWFGPFAD